MASDNKTGKKRYIEDSPEVREAIAELQAKVSKQKKYEIKDSTSSLEFDDIGTDYTDEMNFDESELENKSVEQKAKNVTAGKSSKNVVNKKNAANQIYEQDFESGEYEGDEYYSDDYSEEYEDDYSEEYEEYSEEYAEEEYEEDDEFDEDIAGDTFEEVIDETVTKGTIGDAVRESRRSKKERDEIEREEKRAAKNNKADKSSKKKNKKGKKEEEYIISLEGVSKSYVKGVPALNDVNIKIKKGEFVFIVGGSGSGKSTLIKLLLHELKPSEGTIMVNGFQVDRLRHGKIPKLRRNMGVVFQDFRLLPDMNVYENVAFAQRIIQVPARQMKRNVPNMLAMVGLAGKYKAKPNELSGGEQQRVALARALVNEPPILLADEPTGNLDVKNKIEIMNLLEKINENGTTVIVVTHDDKIVNDMKKRVIRIKKGVIVSDEEEGGYIYED